MSTYWWLPPYGGNHFQLLYGGHRCAIAGL